MNGSSTRVAQGGSVRAAAQQVLAVARRLLNGREIQYAPPGANGGNILYLWLWARARREERPRSRAAVAITPPMKPWLEEFPVLREFTSPRSQPRLLEQRFGNTRFTVGEDVEESQIAEFAQWLQGSSPRFKERMRLAAETVRPDALVVNVRRGDYYSVPKFKAQYGINIVEHLRQGAELLQASGREFKYVHFVSDDPTWCRENLQGVLNLPVRDNPPRKDMFDDLAFLSQAQSLILANSTFSYWGGYFAQVNVPDPKVVVPAAHIRMANDGSYRSPMYLDWWERTAVLPGSAPDTGDGQ